MEEILFKIIALFSFIIGMMFLIWLFQENRLKLIMGFKK